MVVRLSALRTGRIYRPGNISGTHSYYRQSRNQGHSAAGRIISVKIRMTSSGNEPATFRFVAQCLKQMRQHVLRIKFFKMQLLLNSFKTYPSSHTLHLPCAPFRQFHKIDHKESNAVCLHIVHFLQNMDSKKKTVCIFTS